MIDVKFEFITKYFTKIDLSALEESFFLELKDYQTKKKSSIEPPLNVISYF